MLLLMGVIILSSLGASILIPILEQGPRAAIPAGQEIHFKEMNAEDGSYSFGYDTGVGEQQSYRYENRTADGTVQGKYGFITPDGVLREVHYFADKHGYRTFQIDRYPVKMIPESLIGPVPSKLNFGPPTS